MKNFRSIKFTLLGWFLLIALIPMIFISWYGYYAVSNSLREMEESKLDTTAQMNVQFVNDWFSEIERDLVILAGSPTVKSGILGISSGWKKSALPLEMYIKSSQYQSDIASQNNGLASFKKNYDHIHDVLWVDLEGNVLFTLAHEADLGTNLFSGPYSYTRLARAVRTSLTDKQNHFSDTEHYLPSKGILAGFVTTPIYGDDGKMIGVLAFQINSNKMMIKLDFSNVKNKRVNHYLVGSDGLLRSNVSNKLQIEDKRISTRQFWLWKNDHGLVAKGDHTYGGEKAFVYTGPDGESVFGKHYDINILGVKWAHISEMPADEAFYASKKLGEILFLLLGVVTLIIVSAAIYLSNRITRPILELREASKALTFGQKKVVLPIDLNNEIGDLAVAFSQMIDKQLEDAHEIALLAQVVASNPYPTIITDKVGIIEYVNEQMIHESGYDRSELLGMNMTYFRSRKHDETYYAHLWNTIGFEKSSWHGVLTSKIKNRELREWKTTAFPLLDANDSVSNYVFIIEDVTQQKLKDRLFVMQTRQAQMGEMLSMIAHQWRQPLAIINALVAQLLFSNIMREEPDAQLEENLHKIEDQSLHLSHTINDFRDFFRPDKQQESIECSRLVQNAVHLVDHAIKVSSLLFEIKVISDPVISTYTNEMVQVIITLIKNSLDAFEENKISGRNMSITIDQKESYAMIIIEDNAGGISDAIVEKIFLPYFTTKDEDKGTGLGLYMAKIVVEENCHGMLSVSSKGTSTVFTIALPL